MQRNVPSAASWRRRVAASLALLALSSCSVFSADDSGRWVFSTATPPPGTFHQLEAAGAPPDGAAGLALNATGNDPFWSSPPIAVPEGHLPVVRLRLRTDVTGLGQLFYFNAHASEAASVRFECTAHQWSVREIPLPRGLSPLQVRIDLPPGAAHCVWDYVTLESVPADPARLAQGVRDVALDGGQLRIRLNAPRGAELVALPPHAGLEALAETPPLRVLQAGEQTVQLARHQLEPTGQPGRDRVYDGFVLRVREHGRAVPLGPLRYVTQFLNLPRDERPLPQTPHIKGLQVQMAADALALGIRHATINLSLSWLCDPDNKPGNYTHSVDGERFSFNKHYLDQQPVKALSDAGVNVYLILLNYESADPRVTELTRPQRATQRGPNGLYAFDTFSERGTRYYRAALEFLARHYAQAGDPHGRIAGFIVGNELNAHWEWYTLGPAPRETVSAAYERAVRIANTALRLHAAAPRTYISLEHHWNAPGRNTLKTVPGQALFDELHARGVLGGDYDWHVAFHPYPSDLRNPRTWLDKDAPARPDAPKITFRNIEQLPAYLRQPHLLYAGEPRRIILSEQGLNTVENREGVDGEQLQAAAYAYTWNKIARTAGIDAYIYHRHVDHAKEGGLRLGLWTNKPGSIATPERQKPIYAVFKAAATPEWDAAAAFALPLLGSPTWDEALKQ